jgi:cytochrome c oxidase subunit II
MTAIIILLCFILVSVVVVQIGKVTELTAQIKGERATLKDNSLWNAWIGLVFLVGFLVAVIVSAYRMRNLMFGYGPLKSASEHGVVLDSLFNITLFFTGIVFVLTHIALFYFAFKYRYKEGRKAKFISHDNRLEIWWTAIPAVVMAFLVVRGLNAWNVVMADVKEGEDHIEIEATGQQFNWIIRYPGADGKLGTRDFKMTTGNNQLGQDFRDAKNWDDIIPGQELYLPVGKKVRVRITAKDVLHNFDLPHFRVKMDAVPGMPTYFVFTPKMTTSEFRQELRKYPEWNEPFDVADPSGPKRWEKFEYELACAELCGKGHYSMRRVFRVVSQEEYDAWVKTQESFYLTQIHNKDGKEAEDPFWDQTLPLEAAAIEKKLSDDVKSAGESETPSAKSIRLDNIHFATGSANLTTDSKYELDALVNVLTKYPTLNISLNGHTDNVGDAAANLELSKQRAASVVNYLSTRGIGASRLRSAGFGDTQPADSNEKPSGRRKNRRVEFNVLNALPSDEPES